jgi:transcriptional regulator with XRE-family HTH domain
MAKTKKAAVESKGRKRAAKDRDALSVEIGERIARARAAANLTTIASLHKRTIQADPEGKGVSQPVLLGYEAGEYRPGARELKLLSLAMAVTPTWLLFGQENSLKDAPSAKPVPLSFGDLVTLTDEQKRGALLGLLFGYMTQQERDAWIAVVELFLRAKLGDKQFEIRQFALKSITDMLTDGAHGPGFMGIVEKYVMEGMTPEKLKLFEGDLKALAEKMGLPLEEAKKQLPE